MIIQRSSLCMMRTLVSVTKSSTGFLWNQTSLFIYHTAPFPHNCKGKCLSVWIPGCLSQGFIRPSKSPYASQVVIVWKKMGEIHLCLDYQKLNSIMVREAFPLPRIDKAMQAVHSSNWFSSFYLVQAYLQLTMEENYIKRLHLEPVQQVCMSLLICHSDFQMQALVSVIWWDNAWGISNLSPYSFTSMTSASLPLQ